MVTRTVPTTDLQRRLSQLPIQRRVRFLELLRSGGEPRVDRVVPRPRTGPLPLTLAQQRLWFQEQIAPGTSAYNIVLCLRLTGELDVAAWRAALGSVVERHEALRTSLPDGPDGPVQQIAPAGTVDLPVTVAGGAIEDRRSAGVNGSAAMNGSAGGGQRARALALELAWEYAYRPFDLSAGPLWRARLYQVDPTEHLFVFAVHHAVFDALSLGIFTRELSEFYRLWHDGIVPTPVPLPVQCADYAFWQREWLSGRRLDRLITYWREQLADVPVLQLPTDRARPAKPSYRGAIAQQPIDPETVAAVHRLAGELGVTTYVVYLAALFVLLHHYTGQDDLVVGASTAGRDRQEIKDVIGCFVNMVALRTAVPSGASFHEVIRQVDGVVREALAHGELPFGQVVQALGQASDPSRSPVVQVVFNLLGGMPRPEFDGVRVAHELLAQQTAKFDLVVEVADSSDDEAGSDAPAGCRVGAEYSTDLFDPETIDRLLAHYVCGLRRLTADPDRPTRSTDLLSAAEYEELVHGWEGPRRPVPAVTVASWFAREAARTPEAVALIAGEVELSYRELEQAANRLAHLLKSRGAGPGQRVAICLPRGHDYVTAVLAVLKAGAAFVPLDPEHPQARTWEVLRDAQPCLLLTNQDGSARLSGSGSQPGAEPSPAPAAQPSPAPAAQPGPVVLVPTPAELLALPVTEPAGAATPDDPAYLLYTSGSTGRPKGVPITHRSVVNYIEAVRELFGLTSDDCVLAYAAPTYDVSIFEMFAGLLSGARLCIALDIDRLDLDRLQHLLYHREVTVADLPPSVMALLQPEPLDRLRLVYVGGEAFPAELVNRWNQGRRFINGYGPTECTVSVTVQECAGRWTSPPPIGLPLRNHVAHVLDRDLDPLPYGVPGELVIGGVGLAAGYHDRPEQTAAAFVADPFGTAPGGRLYRTGDLVKRRRDGALVFLGRIDRQIKVRGVRIEPGEVEAALVAHDGVNQALVELWRDPRGANRLVGYVVAENGSAPSISDLRAHAAARLPAAVIPELFVVLAELPLTASGKVDRAALPAPDLAAVPPAPIPPRPATTATGPADGSADQADRSGLGRTGPAGGAYPGEVVPASDEVAAAGEVATGDAARSDTEQVLAEQLWAPLLGLAAVDRQANFFESGGGSLQAAQLISTVRRRFGAELSVADFFQNPTVAGVAAIVDAYLADTRAEGGPF